MPSVKLCSAREAARLAAELMLARRKAKSGLSSFSASKEIGQEVTLRPGRRAGGGTLSRYGEVKGDGSTKTGFHEPNGGIIFPRRAECSSDSDSLNEIDAFVTYSCGKFPLQ